MDPTTISSPGQYYVKIFTFFGDPVPVVLAIEVNDILVFAVADYVGTSDSTFSVISLNLQGACDLQIDYSGSVAT